MDIFRLVRTCFLCNGRKNLLRVAHPGYSYTTYCYYHEECLQKVINNPEKYVKNLDSAIQIIDQIRKDEQEQLEHEHSQQLKIQIFRENNFSRTNPTLSHENETENLTKQSNSSHSINSKNETEKQSKFEKIFKNG